MQRLGYDRYLKAEPMALDRIRSNEKSECALNSKVKVTVIFTGGILLSEAGLRLLPGSG